MKASQQAAVLQRQLAEVLQEIPVAKLTWETRESHHKETLASWFWASHVTYFYRRYEDSKRAKFCKSWQWTLKDVILAYPDNPFDVRESLAAQNFVGAIKDEGT